MQAESETTGSSFQQADMQMSDAKITACLAKSDQCVANPQLVESLMLHMQGFTGIGGLEPFTNVNTLLLNKNRISRIEGIACLCSSLRTLNLSDNSISRIEGLNQLTRLHTIDLSCNCISSIEPEAFVNLQKLTNLKLQCNKLSDAKSLIGLLSVSSSLSTLDLSKQGISPQLGILDDVLAQMKQLKVLTLSQTEFSKGTVSYRKETIYRLKALTFLDDRPVTIQERTTVAAWKEGGIVAEREARKRFQQESYQKAAKIYFQMQARTKEVEVRQREAYRIFTARQRDELLALEALRDSDQFGIMDENRRTAIGLQIEDLSQYLKEVLNSIGDLNIGEILGNKETPRQFIQRETPECIFIYHVSEADLPSIKERFYPEEQRPLKCINYPGQQRWVPAYQDKLEELLHKSCQDFEMTTALFNLELYEFDKLVHRKLKRFTRAELESKINMPERLAMKVALDQLD